MKKVYLLVFIMLFGSYFVVMNAQTYKADAGKTVITWEGKKIGKEHHGTVMLKSGKLVMENHIPVSGTIVVDMTTIANTDIDNEDMRTKLIGHLKSDDFFGVESYPEAKLEISGSDSKEGSASVKGNITIKGITQPVEFITSLSGNGDELIFTGKIDLDRSLFNVRYGSKKFFDNIGDNAINDIFTLSYKLYLVAE